MLTENNSEVRYPLDLLPGWTAESVGYHTGDGKLYKGRPRGQPFGPRWSSSNNVFSVRGELNLISVAGVKPETE